MNKLNNKIMEKFGIKYDQLFNISLVITNDPEGDEFSGGTYKLDYENSFMRMDAGYAIIETINDDNIVGKVIELKKIKSYKIWQ
tara:strand:- start:2339 stop:2590 length:252 start_codon:yes stop_codon:yes gene_type:complete